MGMAPLSASLHLKTTHFPSPRAFFPPALHSPKPHLQLLSPIRAAADDAPPDGNPPASTEPESAPKPDSDEDPFDSRLSRVRLKYRSGTGKKAELRKSKKGISKSGSGSGGMYLPPVPLKKPVSDGLEVEFGFNAYTERINGRIAMLGLTALILVELATGKGVINYHTPAIVLTQVYFVAAVAAVYVKFEKEKVSVWPLSSPSNSKE